MRTPLTKQTSQNSSNNFTRCTKDKNQIMKLNAEKATCKEKPLQISKSTARTKIKTGKYTKKIQ